MKTEAEIREEILRLEEYWRDNGGFGGNIAALLWVLED